jgi:hypothetical protein
MSLSATAFYIFLLVALGAVLVFLRALAHKEPSGQWTRRLGRVPTSGLPKANARRYSERASPASAQLL